MTILFEPSANGQSVDIPAGNYDGHILVRKHGCSFRGAGRDVTTLRLDGQFTAGILAANPPGTPDGLPVDRIYVSDLTVDCRDLANVTNGIGSSPFGPLDLVAERVRVIDHRGYAFVVNGHATIRDFESIGGGGVNVGLTSVGCHVYGGKVWGCKAANGLVNADSVDPTKVGTVRGITWTDVDVVADFWAQPTFEEVTPLAFAATYVDVASHDPASRSAYDSVCVMIPVATYDVGAPLVGAQLWDRVEINGQWTQVVGVGADGVAVLDVWRRQGGWTTVPTPSGLATVYRLSLMRLGVAAGSGWTTSPPHRLTMVGEVGARWHNVLGDAVATPSFVAGTRVLVRRHGFQGTAGGRDVDTGCVHVTKTALGARVTRVHSRGGFSDHQTYRGVGTVAEDCVAEIGQDMGFTVDGTHDRPRLRRCTARRAGFQGFIVLGGPADLEDCESNDNGRHNQGYGYQLLGSATWSTTIRGWRESGNREGSVSATA